MTAMAATVTKRGQSKLSRRPLPMVGIVGPVREPRASTLRARRRGRRLVSEVLGQDVDGDRSCLPAARATVLDLHDDRDLWILSRRKACEPRVRAVVLPSTTGILVEPRSLRDLRG